MIGRDRKRDAGLILTAGRRSHRRGNHGQGSEGRTAIMNSVAIPNIRRVARKTIGCRLSSRPPIFLDKTTGSEKNSKRDESSEGLSVTVRGKRGSYVGTSVGPKARGSVDQDDCRPLLRKEGPGNGRNCPGKTIPNFPPAGDIQGEDLGGAIAN